MRTLLIATAWLNVSGAGVLAFGLGPRGFDPSVLFACSVIIVATIAVLYFLRRIISLLEDIALRLPQAVSPQKGREAEVLERRLQKRRAG